MIGRHRPAAAPRRRPARWHRVLGAVTVVVLATTAASCTSSDDSGNGGDLVVLLGRDDSVSGVLGQLITLWNNGHQRKARLVELSGRADEQHDELVKEAQADDSQADVYGLDVTWTSEFASAGYISPAPDPAPGAFLDGPLSTARYGDTVYALPFTTNAGLLYVNADIVGCPADWDEIQQDAPGVAARPSPRPAAVWAGQLAPYEGLVVNVLESLRRVTLGNGDPFSTTPDALNEAVDALRPGPTVLPDSLSYDEAASVQALRQGKVAMLRDWPVDYQKLQARSPENPQIARNVVACEPRGRTTILGGQNLAVAKHSRRAADARALVQFLTDDSAEQELVERGRVPATRGSAYSSDDFDQKILAAVRAATPRPVGPCYEQFSALFSRTVHDALVTGQRLPDGFQDRLERTLECKPGTGQ